MPCSARYLAMWRVEDCGCGRGRATGSRRGRASARSDRSRLISSSFARQSANVAPGPANVVFVEQAIIGGQHIPLNPPIAKQQFVGPELLTAERRRRHVWLCPDRRPRPAKRQTPEAATRRHGSKLNARRNKTTGFSRNSQRRSTGLTRLNPGNPANPVQTSFVPDRGLGGSLTNTHSSRVPPAASRSCGSTLRRGGWPRASRRACERRCNPSGRA